MTPRQRAIAHVADLVRQYRLSLQNPRLPPVGQAFYHERLRSLTAELAQMQVAGPEGEWLARGWCLVAFLD